MQVVCINIDWEHYIKLTQKQMDRITTLTFWHPSQWIIKGWDSSIMGDGPEFAFYKGRRLYPYGKKEWLPLGVA